MNLLKAYKLDRYLVGAYLRSAIICKNLSVAYNAVAEEARRNGRAKVAEISERIADTNATQARKIVIMLYEARRHKVKHISVLP